MFLPWEKQSKVLFLTKSTDEVLDLVPRQCTAATHCFAEEHWSSAENKFHCICEICIFDQ